MSPETKSATEAALKAVNGRLKKGEGWIGYRFTTVTGERIRSKFLYLAFYVGRQQKFVNTKSNDPEAAYRQLLDSRGRVDRGDTILPSDVKSLRYEDLRKLLIDHYREKAPASLYRRKTDNGEIELTFAGSDLMDKFFKKMSVLDIKAQVIRQYVELARQKGYRDPSIRRQLGRLRSAFYLAKGLDLITDSHIPTFNLPADSDARQGFIDVEDFEKLNAEMPAHLHPTMTFLYYTGGRTGATQKITWAMVSKDCTEISLSPAITKNKTGLTIPLVGPLSPVADTLREMRKSFPKSTDHVFSFRNFRVLWNKSCDKLGLGKYDAKQRRYEGLHPHDFRRSAARNLRRAGIDEQTAMRITGHRTTAMFRRYSIQTTDDVKEALIKVGQFKKSGDVVEISAPR